MGGWFDGDLGAKLECFDHNDHCVNHWFGHDYSIHVWRRFEKNRASGMGVWDSMREMYATTGTAL